jgi:transcription-repair coupling factor (superfamily II helicase)
MPDDAKAVPSAGTPAPGDAPPDAALALHLLAQARAHRDGGGAGPVVAVLRSVPRLQRIAALAHAMKPGVQVLSLPPWDVLSYDRTQPSAAIVGQRMQALQALAHPDGRPCLLLTSAATALQRVRPARELQPDPVLRAGDPLDLPGLALDLAARGYHAEERVDEPGTVALRGHVVELFPTGAPCPVRLEVEDGRITALHLFDPLTQRSTGDADEARLTPAVEFPLDPAEVEDAAEALQAPAPTDTNTDADPDASQPAPALVVPPRLVPLTDLLPGAPVWLDPEVPDR